MVSKSLMGRTSIAGMIAKAHLNNNYPTVIYNTYVINGKHQQPYITKFLLYPQICVRYRYKSFKIVLLHVSGSYLL